LKTLATILQALAWIAVVAAVGVAGYFVWRALTSAKETAAQTAQAVEDAGTDTGLAVANSSSAGLWVMARIGDLADNVRALWDPAYRNPSDDESETEKESTP
jgi:hypothetical protein